MTMLRFFSRPLQLIVVAQQTSWLARGVAGLVWSSPAVRPGGFSASHVLTSSTVHGLVGYSQPGGRQKSSALKSSSSSSSKHVRTSLLISRRAASEGGEAASTTTAEAEAPKEEQPAFPFSAMDVRVGTFVSARHHPDSEKLFVEEIDLGEDEPRVVVSGLRAYYNLEQLENQRCLVVANLPKAKLAGVDSFGMVLCASSGVDDDRVVEFLVPPEDAENGDRVVCGDDDDDAQPMTSNQVKKKKVWAAVQPWLAVKDGVATFHGTPLTTPSGGQCRPATIDNGPIS